MKSAEKILLGILLALLICRMAGVPLTVAFFTLACWALAFTYLVFGFRLLRASSAVPLWLSMVAGLALATALVVLPFAMTVRLYFYSRVLGLLNGAFLLFLLIRWGLAKSRRKPLMSAERGLAIRSATLFVVLAFLVLMPPNAVFRSVIIALNRGRVELIANMNMIEAFEDFEEAYDRGDCESGLKHAERANEQGRIWLFGADYKGWTQGPSEHVISLSDGHQLDLDSITYELNKRSEQQELWKISRTYDNLYHAHRCLGERAEEAGDADQAYYHYRTGDSLFNVVVGRTGSWGEERVWSLSSVARTAANIGQYDLSDSLFNASLKLYMDLNDSLDANATPILWNWAKSLARRQAWIFSNKFLRTAIHLSEQDSASEDGRMRFIRYRLQLVKNLITTDSLTLAGRVLAPCQVAYADSALRCEVLLVKGALEYRMDAYRSADSTFAVAVPCMRALPGNEEAKAIALLSWAYTKTALAEYAAARDLVDQGRVVGAPLGTKTSVVGALLQLSAYIHHLQGHYATAMHEYEQSIELLASSNRGADRTPGALAGLSDVLIDLAEPAAAKLLADSAVAMMIDSLPAAFPSQTGLLNTAAHADYCLNGLDRAEELYTISLDVCRRYEAMRSANYAQALNGLGLVAMARSRYASADTLLAQAYATCLAIHGNEHPFTARIMINQAELRMQQRRVAEARDFLIRAMPVTERILGKDHDHLGDIHRMLGDIDRRARNATEAKTHYREALRIYQACFPPEHPKVRAMTKAGA